MDHLSGADQDHLQVAQFDSRFFGVLIDAVILFTPVQVILYFLAESGKVGVLFGQILLPITFILYHIYLIKRFGATPGKLIMKIKVVRSDGENLGWREAILREVVTLATIMLSLAIFLSVYQQIDYSAYLETGIFRKSKFFKSYSPLYKYVSYLSALWGLSDLIYYFVNGRRRALHDHIAGTLVVRTNPYRILSSNY